MNRILRRFGAFALAGASLTLGTGHARAQQPVDRKVIRELQRLAGPYPLRSATLFLPDSAVLVFEDPALGREGVDPETWMFGPPVTAAEADGCPPEKVLGRRLVRLLYDRMGKPAGIASMVVEVRAPAPWQVNRVRMYYIPEQLAGIWAGDRLGHE